MISNYTMRNLVSTRRGTGIVVVSAWALLALVFYTFVYVPNQENLVAAIVRKLDKSGNSTQKALLRQKTTGEDLLRRAATNKTLGLESIQFLNLPHRHDRFDAVAIQAYLADIDYTRFPAVVDSDIKDQGLPPTSSPGVLKKGEIGCWRAHANIWQYQLAKRIPALLILESDAAWDIRLREQMGVLNKPFRELLVQDNPQLFLNPAAAKIINNTVGTSHELPIDPDDPWAARSGLWDILTIGHCFDDRDREKGSFRIYDDPWAPSSGFTFGGIGHDEPLDRQRVVYRATGMVCTTGYILSIRGAAKLLTRSMFNLDAPVDLLMNTMAHVGELTVYSVQQRIIAQFVYRDGLGMKERGAQSDIHNDVDEGTWDMSFWDEASRTHDIYDYKWGYETTSFTQFALAKAWDLLIGLNWDPTRSF